MNPNSAKLQEIWADFIENLSKNKNEVHGLTERKLRERGKLLENESTLERLVFEVERHNAIAGAQYRKGLPMTGFETRLVKYSYEPQGGAVFEIGHYVIDRTINPLSEVIEWGLTFDVKVSFDETTGNYSVHDFDNTLRFTASSLEEAEGRIREAITNLNWGVQLKDEFSPGPKLDAMLEKIVTRGCETAVMKLRDAWGMMSASRPCGVVTSPPTGLTKTPLT
ncbi:MAG: hypothetical protein K1X78_20305 [Verrucomicrobiaceae bacterium]|nr:hypothetical protein [Verrucomicrobiaceae bacterium]